MVYIRKFLILLLLMTFIACSSDDETIIENPTTENPIENIEETISYLALGDSYTIGQSVEESERWPNQLVQDLESNNFTIEKSKIIAQTGWRTSDLFSAIESDNPQGFNLVSLLIGVNNQYANQAFEIFADEFEILLQKAINIAGGSDRVFVVSIPDYGVTPFGQSFGNPQQIASELDMYNSYMSQKCEESGIPFINITDISRDLGDSDGALASDGLHPSGMQYSLWVERILPVVLEIVTH